MAADLEALKRSVEALEEQTGTATLEKMPLSGPCQTSTGSIWHS